MVEGKEFRELMLQVVRTRMAFRRSMQRTLKKNNAGITFEMLSSLSERLLQLLHPSLDSFVGLIRLVFQIED